ncbi:MAG: DotA/TraY family protein [Pelagimonas sp.]|uniref:DotA/TraY family protein n=1 Tax=Pelagimonas sp. TaxID=2073170 RepID=UPI003D6C3BAC
MKTAASLGVATLLLLATADVGMAQEINVPDIFNGTGDDRSNTFFNLIFGDLFPGPAANNRTVISLLMLSFNILFLAVGALFLLYNIFQGTLDSAHEGVVLGQKSTIWVPIRILTAFALLIPLDNGYNGIQHGVSYVVRAGTAAGSFFWNQTADLIVSDEVPIVGTDYVGSDARFLQQLWRMEFCRAAYNFEVSKGGDLQLVSGGIWSNLQSAPATDLIDGYTPQILTYSTPTITSACGSVTLPAATAALKRISPSTNMDTINTSMRNLIDILRTEMRGSAETVVAKISAREPVQAGDIPDLGTMMRVLRQQHSAIVNPIVNPNALSTLVQSESGTPISQQIQSIGSDGSGALSAPTAIAGDLRTGGWMMAGSYYMLISKISGDANAVASMFPTATPGTLISTTLSGGVQNTIASELGQQYWFQSNADRDAQKILASIGASYNASVSAWNEAAAIAGLREFITERAYAGDDASSPENFLPPPTNLLAGIRLLSPETITVDPMIGLMAYASTFLTFAIAVIGILATASAVPVVGSIPATLASLTSGLFQIGIFAAIFVGFILPYLPAVIWLIAILAFMLLVIEAVFAAPLWAVAMLSMDGHGISSNISRKGWSLLLMLFLTPLLMIFGFLLGMVLFRIAAFSLNGMLFAALSSQMAADPGAFGALSSFLTMAVLTVFVGILYVVIIDWSFSLINVFPARVFKWIDGIGDDLGAGTAMTAKAAGVAGSYQGGAATGGLLGSAGNVGLANHRSRQQRQIGNKASKDK